MITLEYEGITLSVPQGWGDVTLGHYERFASIKPSTRRERVALIALIVGSDADTLLSWPAEVFNFIVEQVTFLFSDAPMAPSATITVDGVPHRVPLEDDLTLGEWIDLEEAQKGPGPLSAVLSIVCRPEGVAYDHREAEARRARFEALPVSEVLPVLGFFLTSSERLSRRTEAYTRLRQVADLLPRSLKNLRKVGGGTALLRIWRRIIYYILIRLLRSRLVRL